MRIRSLLLLLAATVVVPGFLAATIAVEKVRESERQAALRGLREAVRATALLVDGQVLRSMGALTSLGNSPSLQNGDLASLYQEALAINQPPDVWTLVLDEHGQQVLNTQVPFGTRLPPPVAQARVASVLASGRPMVSGLITGPVTKSLLTTIYLPAKPTPAGRFVVAQSFSLDHWKKSALRPSGQPDWIVAVIDSDGRFISRSHLAAELLGRQARPELVAAAAAAPEGLIRHSTLEGIQAYDAFVRSSLTGWTIAVAAPVQTIEASATAAVAWLTGGVLVALFAAVVGGSLLGGALIRAIDAAARSARLLGGGSSPATTRTSLDELNGLNDALEDAGRLLGNEQRTREALAGERERLLANEQAARVAAEAENLAKDKFLALLGHELRNPLAAISGATEVLVRGARDEKTTRRLLLIVQRQNRHLRRIVDDLLDVSRMLLGKIVLDPRPLDLADCVRHCLASLSATDQAHEVALSFDGQPTWVNADAVRIEQIVNNLVTNALKFSPAGSTVEVEVESRDGMAVLRVLDHGAGMTPDLLAHIYEPFFQGQPMAGRASNGLGIGLSLVHQLVKLHGGQVRATSNGEDQGSCFEVTLPLAPPAEHAPAEGGGAMRDGCTVLLVEDNPDARESTAEMLRANGCLVIEAEDGETALEVVRTRTPDIVLMDIGLPGRSGHEVARLLRALSSMQGVPLLALSGFGQGRDKADSVDAGFDDHLVKPVDPQHLFQVIGVQLAKRRAAVCAG